MKKNRRKFVGHAMIEFVLVAPMVCAIVFGILEFSILYYDQYVLINAARQGARYGVVKLTTTYPTTAQVITYTKTYCTNLISFASTAPSATVTATASPATPVAGSTLTVVVSYVYTDYALHHFFTHASTYNLSATAVMAYE